MSICIPHASGGDPNAPALIANYRLYSPRKWGDPFDYSFPRKLAKYSPRRWG